GAGVEARYVLRQLRHVAFLFGGSGLALGGAIDGRPSKPTAYAAEDAHRISLSLGNRPATRDDLFETRHGARHRNGSVTRGLGDAASCRRSDALVTVPGTVT